MTWTTPGISGLASRGRARPAGAPGATGCRDGGGAGGSSSAGALAAAAMEAKVDALATLVASLTLDVAATKLALAALKEKPAAAGWAGGNQTVVDPDASARYEVMVKYGMPVFAVPLLVQSWNCAGTRRVYRWVVVLK